MWIQVVIFVIAIILSIILAPKAPEQKPPGIGDVTVPQVSEDSPISVVFGTVVVDGPNIVWYGDIRYEAIVKSSGK